MESFKEIAIDIMGGLKEFRFIPISDIESITINRLNIITEQVILKTGKSMYLGISTIKDLVFAYSEKITDDGPVYDFKMKGFYPGDSLEIRKLFAEMSYERFALFLTDYDDISYFIGSKTEGTRFSHSYNSGEVGGEKGFDFDFTAKFKDPINSITNMSFI